MSDRFEDRTDEELMKAYQSGDEAAFQMLYRRHSAKVYGFLRSKLRDKFMADDVFQATFMKLHATRATYDASFPFPPWLFTVCRSVLADSLRKQHRVLEDTDIAVIEETASVSPDEPVAMPSLDSLSATQRQVIELRYGNALSFEEIAKRLETTPANVRQLASRSVKKLRTLLKKGGEE